MNWTCSLVNAIIIKFSVMSNEMPRQKYNILIAGTIAFKCREYKSYGFPSKGLTF